jgi:alcohol dehydrogenase
MTGVGAVTNTVQPHRGSSIAVIGLGGVGLAALLGTRLTEASIVIACDLSDDKLALARTMGATHTINAGDPHALEQIRDLRAAACTTLSRWRDQSKRWSLPYTATRRGGTTVTAGLSNPKHLFSIPHVGIVAEERTIKGSYLGSCDPARDIPRYIDLYRAGRLPIDRLLSEHIALDQLNEGFDRLSRDARCVKS